MIDVPGDVQIKDGDRELLERAVILIREFPRTLRWAFVFGLYFFDRITFLFGFGFRRFIHLKPDMQKRYVKRWLESRFSLFHDIMTGIRGLVFMCFFSHKDVWDYLGYYPRAHAEERIRLRAELLRRKGREMNRERIVDGVRCKKGGREGR